jgi:hypothetical protein
VPIWLNNLPSVTLGEKVVYGWLIFRADDDGVFRKSLRSVARDAHISFQHLRENLIPSMKTKGLIHLTDRGERVPAWIAFTQPSALKVEQLSCPASGQFSCPEKDNFVANSAQHNWPHKEAKTQEAAAAQKKVSDYEWLRQLAEKHDSPYALFVAEWKKFEVWARKNKPTRGRCRP